MKRKISRFLTCLLLVLSCLSLASCDLEKYFIFGVEPKPKPTLPEEGTGTGDSGIILSDDFETFEGTKNAIFFALYNYYGYEGQHFTNKWLGMNDALAAHGIKVTGYEGQKDARRFKIERLPECDLPEDAVIYMVNNQNWDAGIQFNKPFAQHHPMAVLSTCNGVEFAASPILATGDKIANATMGGFSDTYRQAFVDDALEYLVAKYSAHILPIFAASVDAVENGQAMKNADGTALHLSITTWAIQTLAQYDEMSAVDSIDAAHPTLRKINVDQFFDKTSENYGPEKLKEWVADSSKENIKALYEENGTNQALDEASYRQGKEIKCGIITPSSINDQVGKYITYIREYLATAYNITVLPLGSVTNTNTQKMAANQLCNQGADFIISLQDDTERNDAAMVCNERGVYFAIAGSCQSEVDYEVIKNLPYYVGSIGTSTAEERRSAREMTEYYLQCMIKRAESEVALYQHQIDVKGLDFELNVPADEETPVCLPSRKDEENVWLS